MKAMYGNRSCLLAHYGNVLVEMCRRSRCLEEHADPGYALQGYAHPQDEQSLFFRRAKAESKHAAFSEKGSSPSTCGGWLM